MKPGQVRIISGRWRGKKIPVPDLPGVRPTCDRVRETLFNWLGRKVINARCLDLFAGTGILGFEALSRGAQEVVFVDNAQPVIIHLRTMLKELAVENVSLVKTDAATFSSRTASFDIVFLDPPFGQGLLSTCCKMLSQSGMLAQDALIYIERESEQIDWQAPETWERLRSQKAGKVCYSLYQNSSRCR